jgi:cobaltochelatase CobT
MPGGQQARAVFDSVEQARVEAIGARRMHGVARNLAAMLDDRFHRGKFDDITDRADAPIEDAVALMVRERLTGLPPPPAAKKLVDLWRPWVEDRAGRDLDRLGKLLEDQRRFADVVHDLLDSLEMGEERNPDSEEDEQDQRDQDRKADEQGGEGEAQQSDEADGMSIEETEVAVEELPEGASEAADAPSAEMADDAETSDADTASEPWRPRHSGLNEPRGPDYRPFTTKFDEIVGAEDLCEPEELDRLAAARPDRLAVAGGDGTIGAVADLAARLGVT